MSLLDRESELALVGARLDAISDGRAAFLATRGEPGIGKTSVMAAARRQAEHCGLRVLSARGSDLELADARSAVGLAERFGAASAVGSALRVRGRLSQDAQELTQAVEALAASPARLDHARRRADRERAADREARGRRGDQQADRAKPCS